MPGHDIIVVGASAGGWEPLMNLVSKLPRDLPAAVFVVLHLPPYSVSYLPRILSRRGPLPAEHPPDRSPIERGRIYVAPPDHHLLVRPHFVRVVQGPKENNLRPAADPLFRTAAVAYGPRVVGIVLSGMLDDGSAGLLAIKNRGGVAIVQDPDEAIFRDMPHNAMQAVGSVDHCLKEAAIPRVIEQLARQPVDEQGAPPVTHEMEKESQIDEFDFAAMFGDDRPGQPSPFTCPDCKGDLWEIDEGGTFRFRCRIGHAWSPHSLLAGQSEKLEDSLSEAFRALKEKAHLERRMAKRAQERRSRDAVRHHEQEVLHLEQHAEVIRQILVNLKSINSAEVNESDPQPERTQAMRQQSGEAAT